MPDGARGLTRWLWGGSFWLADDGTTLHGFDRSSGARVRIDGALRGPVLEGRCDDARLRAAAALDPHLRALLDALSEHAPRPLTRADVLRGAGFQLLFVELTGQCNERCSHCYADAAPERTERLELSLARQVIDDAAGLGFGAVQLTGGDPLLHPHVVEAAVHARQRGIEHVEIYTNGLLLGSRLIERLAPAEPRFAFSMYAGDPTVHDAITGVAGSHARTLRAIRNCREQGLAVRVGVVLFEHTEADREAIAAALQAAGVPPDAIGFSSSREVGRGRAHSVPDAGGSHAFGVGREAGKACVAYDGNVYPCIFARQRPLGSVRERSLRAILLEPGPIEADVGGIDARTEHAGLRLSCLECRMRDVMLAARGARPVALRLAGAS